jgi:hypothetical protein
MSPIARNARAEAAEVIGHRFEVRVLEPSPPAIDDGDWYADDPAIVGEVAPGTKVVTATSAGDLTWESLAREDGAAAEFARRHWLVSRPLPAVPEGLVQARTDLNRLIFYVLSPARAEATGRIALRATAGGFGTPFFGDDVQIRLEGTDLVIQEGVTVRHRELGSLAAAAEFVGVELDPSRGEHDDVPAVGDPDRPLAVNDEQAAFLADWFAFGTSALEELRLAGRPVDDVSRVQLWAEHFDPAVEIGSAERGARATYGASPGDAAHDEPYLYVAAWGEIDRSDPYWNDEAFNGANLSYAELAASDDPRQTALAFYTDGLAKLRGDDDRSPGLAPAA